MKNIVLLLVFGWVIFLVSCDKIEGPYRDVSVTVNDTSQSDTTKVYRKVLVEDYTGHTCGNCPRAAEAADSIIKNYKGKVVVVAVHAGFFAKPKTTGSLYTYDFRNTASTEFDAFFGIGSAGNPNGMINRRGYPNLKHIIPYPAWDDSVAQFINKLADASIKIEATVSGSTVNTTVSGKFLNSLTGNYNLGVYFMEDSIVNWQKDYAKNPQDIPNYLHRHVLRGAISSTTWGDQIAANPAVNTAYSKSYTYTMAADVVAKNGYVVAMVFNKDTYEVIQVDEKKIQP